MAKRRKKKKTPLKVFLLFILTPVIIWLLAFLIWLYWSSLARLFGKSESQSKFPPKAARPMDRRERPDNSGQKPPQEQIQDEDRKKLDEILRQRHNHN